MKKTLSAVLAVSLLVPFVTACGAPAKTTEPESTQAAEETTLTGKSEGYGGELVVEVVKAGDTIKSVTIVSNNETEGIGSNAVEQLPDAIVKANSTEVDGVSGATFSSNAIKAAVNNALDPEKYPYVPAGEKETETAVIEDAEAYIGFGTTSSGRIGPGKDDTETPVYSINQVFAQVIFDKDGKITLMNVDQMEVATPNYDGAGMPHFSGFPGQGGYNLWDDAAQKVNGKSEDSEENFLEEVSNWTTKRERGEDYKLGSGTWASEMDAYEKLFVGKTVDEVEEWFGKYCSDANGRPLTAESDKEGDAEKYAALTEEEKTQLTDVTSGATMSLKDSHGDIIGAIRAAYESRMPADLTGVTALGFGLTTSGRVGPGKDDTETPVYSINEVLVTSLLDKDGKIANVYVDQVEVATPNYDGSGMPHFSGFPSQGGYNLWDDTAQKVDGKSEDSEDNFLAEVSSWTTKRQRGEDYKLGSGTWASEMDRYQELFIGKTPAEIEEWYGKYCSDANGRPLTAESDKEGDADKYAALSDEEKAELTDVTSSATMSLNDSHGNIIGALVNSTENIVEISVQ